MAPARIILVQRRRKVNPLLVVRLASLKIKPTPFKKLRRKRKPYKVDKVKVR